MKNESMKWEQKKVPKLVNFENKCFVVHLQKFLFKAQWDLIYNICKSVFTGRANYVTTKIGPRIPSVHSHNGLYFFSDYNRPSLCNRFLWDCCRNEIPPKPLTLTLKSVAVLYLWPFFFFALMKTFYLWFYEHKNLFLNMSNYSLEAGRVVVAKLNRWSPEVETLEELSFCVLILFPAGRSACYES